MKQCEGDFSTCPACRPWRIGLGILAACWFVALAWAIVASLT